MSPKEYLEPLISTLVERRGEQKSIIAIDDKKVNIKYRVPLSEIITDFFDKLKSITKGYGSMDYEIVGY
jgi:GTP-binding protein LepA